MRFNADSFKMMDEIVNQFIRLFPSKKVILSMFGDQEEENPVIEDLATGIINNYDQDFKDKGQMIVETTPANPPVNLFGFMGLAPEGETVRKTQAVQLSSQSLTQREREILKLIVDGKSNKEISAILRITVRTVKAHIGHIFQKLGVYDRTQAAVLALRRQIY
jgi:DNA-binding NarL/FixJ family response regulator